MARYDTHWQGSGKRKRDMRVRWMRLLVGPAAVLAVLLLVWVIIDSPLLRVRGVEVEGAGRVDKAQVLDAAAASPMSWWRRMITRANVLGWPTTLAPEAVALVPGAKKIDVDRRFFSGTVALTVTERDPVGMWCFEATGIPVCEWFDEEGVVYGRAFVSQGSLIPVVHDRSQEKAGEGRRVLPKDQLDAFLAITQIMRTRNISPKEMEVTAGTKQELTVVTYNGPKLMFTLRTMPDQVATVLDDFIKRGNLNSVQYIDFRSPKRAFYQ